MQPGRFDELALTAHDAGEGLDAVGESAPIAA